MADRSSIEWTDATWNPVRGCTRVSPGCGGPHHQGGCYAETLAARFSDPGQPFHGFAERTQHGGRWTGELALVEDKLADPLKWKKPRRIFVNSMSDLFHEALPDEAIDRVFAVMAQARQHTFQVLTKRAKRMREYLSRFKPDGQGWLTPHGEDGYQSRLPLDPKRWPLPNVWLGVSAEDQANADERIPELLATPAAIRFVSAEPLLGPIDFNAMAEGAENLNALSGLRENPFGDVVERRYGSKLDWIIVGGESGPHARPMHPDWARSIRDQAQAAGVAFFFKQWGEFRLTPAANGSEQWPARWFGSSDPRPNDIAHMTRVGKKRAGRLLDGVEHNSFPEVAA